MNPHDDQHGDQRDPLRERLGAADPAASLAPTDPGRVTRLLEDAMSETDERAGRRRTPATWLAGAAAAVAVAGVSAVVVLGGDVSSAPTAGGDDADPSAAPALVLEVPTDAPGRCVVPSADLLAQQETAFLGTVDEVGDGVAELRVDEAYAGVEGTTVDVVLPGDLPALVGAVDFRAGEQYLVSATDGRLAVCGFSGPATPELQALYDEAFGG